VTFAAACGASSPPVRPPAGIVIPDDASALVAKGEGDYFEASYQLRRSFPADGFLATARAQVAGAGFQPLEKDWLNPGIDSGHIRGWTPFTQGAGDRPERVHQWSAQWADGQGNVVLYFLQYRSQPSAATVFDGPTTDVLNVNVARIPASQAAAMRQAAAQYQPKLNGRADR
jgi:hypothetical protein